MPYSRKCRTVLFVRTAARIMSLLVLLVSDTTIADSLLLQRRLLEQPLSHDVRCVLRADTASWKQNRPAPVVIRLENLTDRNLDLVTVPTLHLSNARIAYWSPIDIVENKALQIRQQSLANGKAVGITAVPLKIHLQK